MLLIRNGFGEIRVVEIWRVELNGGGRESNSAMNNNTWRHVAAVFPENATNLNSIKFYIDGVETGYASGYTTMPNTGDYLDVRLGMIIRIGV